MVSKFEKVFLYFLVVFILFNLVVMFFLFFNIQSPCLKNSCFDVSPIVIIDTYHNIEKYSKKVHDIDLIRDIQEYILNCMYVVFENFIIFYKFLCSLFVSDVKKIFYKNKNSLINKIMHQSFNLLNQDMILNTTTIIELERKSEQDVWVIQLGAFKNFQKALKIVSILKIYNYPVYIYPENPKSEDLVRVFVGPYSSKDNLEYVLNDLYHISSLFGKIVFYRDFKKQFDIE